MPEPIRYGAMLRTTLRSRNENGSSPVTYQQFLNDKSGLYGFPQTDVIRNKKIDSRHLNSSY